MFRNTKLFVLVFIGAAFAGCRTVPNNAVTAFSSAVSTAHTQSQEALAAVNAMMAESSLDFAAGQPTLNEASFAAGLDQDSLQAWDDIFAELEKYAHHLQAVTSPDIAKQFEDESVNLSTELKGFGDHLQQAGLAGKSPSIPPSIATGFVELGSLIIRAQAQAKALKAMAGADTNVVHIFRTMADSIGSSTAHGIRGTVHAHWNQLLDAQTTAFLGATDSNAKRQIASAFRDLLQRRDAQDLVLASLRRSLLELANLHHALAQGETWTAQAALSAIAGEIQRTRDLNDRFSNKPSGK